MTTEIDYTKFGPHEATFRAMIPTLVQTAQTHDELVDRLNVKEGEISEDIMESARLRNKDGNKRVKQLNETIAKALEQIEKFKAECYDLVKDDLPQPLTDEERPAIQEQVKNLRQQYKVQYSGVEAVADMVGIKSALEEITLPTIKTNGRVVSGGSGGTRVGHHGPRLRFKEVYINGELAEGKSTNDPNKKVSNFSMAANKLKSELKTQNVSASDLQEAYFKAAGTEDASKINSDFTFTYVYVDGENKREFEIRAVRN